VTTESYSAAWSREVGASRVMHKGTRRLQISESRKGVFNTHTGDHLSRVPIFREDPTGTTLEGRCDNESMEVRESAAHGPRYSTAAPAFQR